MKHFLAAFGASLMLGAVCVVSADPLPPDEVKAGVTLTVDASHPAAVVAKAHIEFQGYYHVTQQLPMQRDSAGRFILQAAVEQVAVIQIFPPPPFPVADLSFQLGSVPAGTYGVVFKMNGKVFAEKTFTVGKPPPTPEAIVTAQVESTATGSVAHVRLELPDPYFAMSDAGQPVRDGQMIRINCSLVPVVTLVVLPSPGVIKHDYPLGLLPKGEYRLVYQVNGYTKLELPFVVAGVTPPPAETRLAFIEIKPGPVSTVAAVGLILPAGKMVTNWGEVKTEGTVFRAAVTVGDAVPTTTDPPVGEAPVTPSGVVAKHLYSLGLVAPGQYTFEVLEGTRLLGAAPFRVEPKPPEPPLPRPVVAFIQPGHDSAGWFVDLGLAFTRPALEVKDWGTPARVGNKFKVSIQIGEATPPPVPAEPPSGGTPVFLGPPLATDDPPSPLAPIEAEPFREIGDWPAQLVHHRYPLGALEPGEYVFAVVLGGEEVAQKGFVADSTSTPGPSITVRAAALEKKTQAMQTFTVIYEAAVGFKSDPDKSPVMVRGPHDFRGKAVLTGCIPSLDPIGRLFSCSYEVAGPGGDWDAADNGEYTICVDPSLVVDRNGRPLARPCAFGWQVRIQPEPPPHLETQVAVSMKDGIWQADVSFENTGGWFTAAWGTPRLNGLVFAAGAELRVPPAGSMVPIPMGFEHSYPLGELKPGRYLFVFKSNAGHCGSAAFVVPGVEPPTPLVQWQLNTLGASAGDNTADDDHDGLPVFAEFYLACQPDRSDLPNITPALAPGTDGEPHLALDFRRASAGDGSVRCVVEVSADMSRWQEAGDDVELQPGTPDLDGTQMVRAMQKLPAWRSQWRFMRLRLEQAGTP